MRHALPLISFNSLVITIFAVTAVKKTRLLTLMELVWTHALCPIRREYSGIGLSVITLVLDPTPGYIGMVVVLLVVFTLFSKPYEMASFIANTLLQLAKASISTITEQPMKAVTLLCFKEMRMITYSVTSPVTQALNI